ncbi:hypothetical protein P3532_22820 [Vibrio parahaemolyticus]|uniref:hypothetical protein n=1 Tax=Vibrio TaxID=662 RepID=UPI000CE4F013|nr:MULTISPECIES: hypothetical protein [Vibrio]EJB8540592.1 hypothetical protein [Vibrio parahaemolyticus]MBO0190187.1 hypothetical protein [Vibrio parahaemolyticus]MBO0221604.1 hypothetical protein [Vibrio parahaemolyticus]MDF4791793.1 hypothetical protein [Vibrio parahaemolyticus]HBC3560401.1 hypothetical protein [Vibrio parahaemolyticus]
MDENQTEGQFTFEPKASSKPDSKPRINEKHLVGKIASQIGTGQNAKDSFIWMTITWSFYISTGLSAAIFLKYCFITPTPESDYMTYIKDIWSIFTPIITLALGYAFGKGQ